MFDKALWLPLLYQHETDTSFKLYTLVYSITLCYYSLSSASNRLQVFLYCQGSPLTRLN